MPQVKPFHPDLGQKLDELFKCRHGEMPCKEERTKLGAPYAETAMRIQSRFTRKAREKAKTKAKAKHRQDVSIRSSRAEDLRSLRSVQTQRNHDLSPILIKHLEGRFTKDGPRSPSEKTFKRISETYNVSQYSIEKWWHCRQRTGGKICIPRHPEHRGGKIAELEVRTTAGMGSRRLSASRIFSPTAKVFKARDPLHMPSASIPVPLTAFSVLFSERPETPSSETTYLSANSSPEPFLLHDIGEFSTHSSPLESVVEFAHPLDADTTSSACFSSPFPSSHALMTFTSSAPSPTFSGFVPENTPVYGQIFAQDLIWDLHETMTTGKNMNRVLLHTSHPLHSHWSRMYAASELETASFVGPDDPHWRLVGQDLMAAVRYKRNRALWDSSTKVYGSRRLSEQSGKSDDELKLSGETNENLDELIQRYVHCDDDSWGSQNPKPLLFDTPDSVLFPLCGTMNRSEPRPLGSSMSRPPALHSTSTPCFPPDRIPEPMDPTSSSTDTSCVSTPYPESPEDPYLSDHEHQLSLRKDWGSWSVSDNDCEALLQLRYTTTKRISHRSLTEYYEPSTTLR